MSGTALGINLTIAALLILAALLALGLCRAAGRPHPVKETRGQRVWDEGLGAWVRLPYGVQPEPYQLTEAEVNVLDGFQIALNELATDPEFTARRERLYDAVRDSHDQKGDQA